MNLSRNKLEKRLLDNDTAMLDVYQAFDLQDQFIHADLGSFKSKLSWLSSQMYQQPIADIVTPTDTYFVKKKNPYSNGMIDYLTTGYAIHEPDSKKTLLFTSGQDIHIIKNGKLLDTVPNYHVELNTTKEGQERIHQMIKEFV